MNPISEVLHLATVCLFGACDLTQKVSMKELSSILNIQTLNLVESSPYEALRKE